MTISGAAAAASPAGPIPPYNPNSRPVLLLAVPDLRWSDLADMPNLRALETRSSVSNLSVRSSGEATRCGDGLLELSAGTRVPSGIRPCDLSQSDVARLAAQYRSTSFRPRVGALGDLLNVSEAVGTGASVLASGTRHWIPAAAKVSDTYNLTYVVDDRLYGVPASQRSVAARAVDTEIPGYFGPPLGSNYEVIVAGISDGPTGPAHLHPLVVHDPGEGAAKGRLLTSASTGRDGYVQLVDITATVLTSLGARVPDSMIGRPITATDEPAPALSALADDDRHARAADDVSGGTRNTLALVLVAAILLLLARRREAWLLARAVAAAPVLTFVVQLVPWWRWGTATYAGFVAAGSIAVAATVTALERRNRTVALLAVPAVTALVLVADQLAGAPLQLSAPMGDNPLVAGRFHGMGNTAFGLMAASALFCAGVLAGRVSGIRARLAIVAGIGVVALAVDGLPQLGDDFGGLLALLPAVVLLGALVAGVRLTWRRVAIVAGLTLLVAAAVGAIDAARPEDRRTHIGRFVAHLVHGHLDPVVDRKWRAMLRSFGNVGLDVLVAVTAITAVTARKRLPALAARVEGDVGLRATLLAVAVVGVLGTLLNDSGVVVAASAALAVVPAVIGDTRSSGAG